MFERFTDRARRVVVLAQDEARALNHNYIGTEHVLLGLIHEGEGAGAAALEAMGLSLEEIRRQVEEIIGQGQEAPSGHIPFTPRAKKVLELALREALQFGHNYVGTEHIMLGLIREGEGVASQVLTHMGADMDGAREQVTQLLRNYQSTRPPAGSVEQVPAPSPSTAESTAATQPSRSTASMFERFTDRSRRVVVLAQEEARMLNHNYIGTEHILLGLIHEGEGVGAAALQALGISLDAVRQQIEEIIGQGQQAPSGDIPFTPRARAVLELSLREALQLGHNYIGTEHLLLALTRESESVAAQILVRLGADLDRVRELVIQLLHGYQGTQPAAGGRAQGSAPATEAAAGTGSSRPGIFERFTDRSRRVVVLAQEEARMLNHNLIGPEHFLLGMIHESEGVAAAALRSLGISSLDAVRQQIEEIAGRGAEAPPGHIPFAPRGRALVENSLREALQLGHNYIGTEHLLLALTREDEGVAAQILASHGVGQNQVRQQVIQLLHGYQGTQAAAGGQAQGAAPAAETAEGVPPAPSTAGMFARFTDRSRRLVVLSQDEARTLRHDHIGTEHLLLGLLQEGHGIGAAALEFHGIGLTALWQEVAGLIGRGEQTPTGHIPFTPEAKKALELSLREALQLGDNYIGTQHILLGLISQGDGVAAQVLVRRGADLSRMRRTAAMLSRNPAGGRGGADAEPGTQGPLRANLTQQAREGRLGRILGRSREVQQLIEALRPGAVGSPLLIGQPGVGVAPVVHGLAQAIVRQEAAAWLAGKEVREVDVCPPGNARRSPQEIEAWMAELASYVRQLGNTILFVRNAFLPVEMAEGTVQPVAFLEPLLAGGETPLIATATPAGHRQGLAAGLVPDGMFQQIVVNELPEPLVVAVLQEIRDRYESQHQVTIPDAAITAAVTLSAGYGDGHSLPGRAIDMLDQAAARAAQRSDGDSVAEAEQRRDYYRREKEAAIDTMDFERAAEMRGEEKRFIAAADALKRERREWTNMPGHRFVPVTEEDVAGVLADHGRPGR
jgi:ATP-dependent Clp protease ATP-binding subunit ClpA